MADLANCIGYGTHADRPAPGAPGAIYCESDTGNGYRDNGVSWDLIIPAPAPSGLAFLSMSADHTLTAGNVNVLVTATGLTLTLPAVAAANGQAVAVVVRSGLGSVTVAAHAGEHFDGGGTSISVSADMLWCDGTQWYEAGY